MTHAQAPQSLIWSGAEVPGRDVPDAVIRRLPGYLHAVETLVDAGQATVSSEALAELSGVHSATLRKDLANLGSTGTRGVGYSVGVLSDTLRAFLGIADPRRVVIIGAGHLGTALADYPGFADRGFDVVAVLDSAESVVGRRVGSRTVEHISSLDTIVAERSAQMAVVTVPASAAAEVCAHAVRAGIGAILNFAPVVVTVPPTVQFRQVDLATELQVLAFRSRQQVPTPLAGLPAEGVS